VNLLARDASFEIFGQVGILYLMFLAGIEIDMYHLKNNLKKGMVFGAYTFFVPMIVGTLTSYYLLNLDWLTSILLASMYASHTLIAYPIVSRFGLTKSSSVIIAIAGTIITVLGALIVLAVCVGIHTEGAFHVTELLMLMLRLAVYCLLVVYSFPRITRWFFKKYNDNITQFVYVLAMVFLASYASKIIGLESVLGAFLAGLVLNRYIPNMSPLMNRIEFVGNAIFIPYFLIGVGMLINVEVIIDGWSTVYVAAVMTVVATVCKWLAAWFTQKTYHMISAERSMLFGLSNAQAAATLAAVMIGFQIGMFDESVLNGTIVMILVTCAIASIITERASQRLKMQQLASDSEPQEDKPISYNNTLISVANPITASSLVDLAMLLRNSESRRDKMFAVHVRSDNSAGSRAIGKNSLDLAQQAAASVDAKLTVIERYDMNVVAGLVNTIAERDITEVILGMHRKANIIDSFFGSKIEHLLQNTNKMVIITRCFIPVSTITRIVVTVPDKAQYETGFSRWVCVLANLTRQLGCRIIFCCAPEVQSYIRGVLYAEHYEIRHEYRDMEEWDDFVMLANRVLDDDLFVVINARRSSVSFNSTLDELPGFLQKYFSRNNLVVLYPEQFGAHVPVTSFVDPLAGDISATPNGLWVKLAGYYRRLIVLRKRFTHRNRVKKIDL
jgi:Kef-type K+ transport system membrane component KefB